jgi:hypothetical protein
LVNLVNKQELRSEGVGEATENPSIIGGGVTIVAIDPLAPQPIDPQTPQNLDRPQQNPYPKAINNPARHHRRILNFNSDSFAYTIGERL